MEFHRVQLEEWHSILRTIGFVLFLAVFILMLLRVIFMPKSKVEHDSALPLQNETTKEPHANGDQKQSCT
jgi:hypothetical protein